MEDYPEWERKTREEVMREAFKDSLVCKALHAKKFPSWSRGRGRKRREYPREVILLQRIQGGPWRFWSGDTSGGGHRWDAWAMEIFGDGFCEQLLAQGISPEEYLQRQVLQLLKELGGQF